MIIGCCVVSGLVGATVVQDKAPKKVKRVKKPVFTERDSDGIFFNNLFEEGLVGKRPSADSLKKKPSSVAGVPAVAGNRETASAGGAFAWSKFIERNVIEDEVKSLEQRLQKIVTTPGRFKSEYGTARQTYSTLSMLFAIISEYDSDVRWKKDSRVAQLAFSRAAAVSRTGTQQAYQNAKICKEDLTELIRGGNFSGKAPTSPAVDWSQVVDRGTLMELLEDSFAETLKPGTGSKTEMNKKASAILHQANLVAAIGQALTKDGMDEAEEEDYSKYAVEMSKAAMELSAAVKVKDYDTAAAAVNTINQSCSNCHDEWR